ncbi:MAG: putative FAD-linked oxidoreductase, partial [Belnapia sp.]|nr:putative FAD-linked oxidoreductase [Belnapia sp.]
MTSLDALADALGPRNILTTAEDMAPYAVDWRGSYRGTPQAVLRPGTAEEVAAALRIATQAGLAVVPAGGR